MQHLAKSVFAAALAATSLTLSSFAASAETITVRYSNWLPANYFLWEKIIDPWMKEVEAVTEGRVKFEVLPKAVGSVGGSYDTVMDGMADASTIVPSYNPGRFIPHEGLELPWLGDDMVKRSTAAWHVYEKYLAPAGVFGEIKVISVFPTTTAHVFTNGAEIDSVGALEGLKLRSPGQLANQSIEAMKAVPVTKPIPEVYELLSGRVIDGVVTNADSIVGFRLDGAVTKGNYLEGGLASTQTMIGMNKAVWEKISEADRAAIDKISGLAFAIKVAHAHHENMNAAIAKMEAGGVKTIHVDAAVVEELKKLTQPVIDGWVANAEQSGFADAKAMMAEFQQVYESTTH